MCQSVCGKEKKMKFYVREYKKEEYENWDKFIAEKSINGTFLQMRKFLSYHPEERFMDASKMIYDEKNNLAAVCPACMIIDNGRKIFFSHKGSTYGGILFDKKNYTVEKVLEIIRTLERQLIEDGFQELWLKITPTLFSQEADDLLKYCLCHEKYDEYKELNLYVDLQNCKEDMISNLAQGKRTNVHNCEKRGLILKKLESYAEIMEFHEILKETLSKYGLSPIHTVDELWDFKINRLTRECDFYGIYDNTKMIAGSMMFYFLSAGTAHTQYLCARHEYDTLSPMTYMYYCMMKEAKLRGFKKISWGITTEHLGLEINSGLTKSKEAFGSTYANNGIFHKVL